MPTNRRRLKRSRVGSEGSVELNFGREAELTGGIFIGMLADAPFLNDDHRRRTWLAHRDDLVQEYSLAGRRPWGWWRFDMGVPLAGEGSELRWRAVGAQSESDAVYRLLQAGKIAPAVPDEVAEIERRWLRHLAPLVHWRNPTAADALRSYGIPDWFARKHLPGLVRRYQEQSATTAT